MTRMAVAEWSAMEAARALWSSVNMASKAPTRASRVESCAVSELCGVVDGGSSGPVGEGAEVGWEVVGLAVVTYAPIEQKR